MKILFTVSDYPLSKLIRKVTGEPVSHVALLYSGFVIHSTVGGVQITMLQHFMKHGTIIYELPCQIPESTLLQKLEENEGRGYDYGALIYLGLRSLAPGLLPKKNLWQTSGMFLCTEWATDVIEDKPDSMITPYQLYLQLKENTV